MVRQNDSKWPSAIQCPTYVSLVSPSPFSLQITTFELQAMLRKVENFQKEKILSDAP